MNKFNLSEALNKKYATLLESAEENTEPTLADIDDSKQFKKQLKESYEEPWALCPWCGDLFPVSDLHMTDMGVLCTSCIEAIRSHEGYRSVVDYGELEADEIDELELFDEDGKELYFVDNRENAILGNGDDYGFDEYDVSESLLTEAPRSKTVVPVRIPKNKLNDPSSFDIGDQVRKDVKAKDDAIAAEKEKKRIAKLDAKGKSTLDKIMSNVKNPDDIDDIMEAWFDELVPRSGAAGTVGGELIRAISKIRYRYWNDGDRFFTGYGIETCGSAVSYLCNKLNDSDFVYQKFEDIATSDADEDAYTNGINEVASYIVKYLTDNPRYIVETTTDDYLDTELMSELDVDDDGEWIPRCEFTVFFPDEVVAHMDAGNIDVWDVKDELELEMENSNTFTGAEIDTPWSHTSTELTITNLTSEGYQTAQSYWGKNGDGGDWSYYINELNDNYGPVDDEDDEDWDEEEDEDTIDESLNYKPLQKAHFGINEGDDLVGYYDPNEDWNGFDCPWFELDVALKVADNVEDFVSMSYDKETDTVIAYDKQAGEEFDHAQGMDLKTVDGVKHLYPVGNCSWVWLHDESSTDENDKTLDNSKPTEVDEAFDESENKLDRLTKNLPDENIGTLEL